MIKITLIEFNYNCNSIYNCIINFSIFVNRERDYKCKLVLTMNTDVFIKRFKEILEDNRITASVLADELEIQRSSISHLLSGRNKPSLDFILKLLKKYPEINMYWLLNGTGAKYKADKAAFKEKAIEQTSIKVIPEENIDALEAISNKNKKIKHIVVFYEDATFESYTPN